VYLYDHDPQLKVPTDYIHQMGLTHTHPINTYSLLFFWRLSAMQVMSSSITTHLLSFGSYPQ